MDCFSLKGKVAIVTGCRVGLGAGIAAGLAQAGAHIFGVGSNPDMSETKEKVEAFGVRFESMAADLTSIERVDEIVNTCLEKFGRVDILVNNAGIIRREDAVNFSEKDWDDVININLKTVFFLSQRVAKEFIRRQSGGKIINVASMLSYQGGFRVPSYTASKSGVLGLTKEMANEWAKYRINVNAIAPGYMETDITQALREDKKRAEQILSRIPAGRWGKPEDIAGPAVFLASSASDYVNGFTLAVDGGWLAW